MAQRTELEAFQQSVDRYIEYASGDFEQNEHPAQSAEGYRQAIDKTFRAFVLAHLSEGFEDFYTGDGPRLSMSLEQVTVYVQLFAVAKKTYAAFGYSSSIGDDYYIKDIDASRIVYRGNKRIPFICGVYGLDAHHILLIEQYGDMNLSRRAFVVNANKTNWEPTAAFEGLQWNYGDEMLYKKRRMYLHIEMSFATMLNAPKKASEIYFDPISKRIFYKKYLDGKETEVVDALWEKGKFGIDDYDVGEDIMGYPAMEPAE